MKKFIYGFIAALFVFGFMSQARAELSAQSYSAQNIAEENQVYTYMYNQGANITSNSLVCIDTTAPAAYTGSYIATTTTANDARVIGVTDEVILSNSTGKVCVRGPHKVLLSTANGVAAAGVGASLASVATAGTVGLPTVQVPQAKIGFLLNATATTATSTLPNLYWIWVQKN